MKNLETLSLATKNGGLVLSRKVGEQIVVEDVIITITKIHGKKCSVMIQADDSVRIARGELLQRIPA